MQERRSTRPDPRGDLIANGTEAGRTARLPAEGQMGDSAGAAYRFCAGQAAQSIGVRRVRTRGRRTPSAADADALVPFGGDRRPRLLVGQVVFPRATMATVTRPRMSTVHRSPRPELPEAPPPTPGAVQ